MGPELDGASWLACAAERPCFGLGPTPRLGLALGRGLLPFQGGFCCFFKASALRIKALRLSRQFSAPGCRVQTATHPQALADREHQPQRQETGADQAAGEQP